MDDVDAGDANLASAADVLVCDWSVDWSVDWAVSWAVGGVKAGSASGFDGLLPVTGLQTPELSSGQRKTSMGPRVLFRDTW